MIIESWKRNAARSALLAGAALSAIAVPALAQDTGSLDEIVVTGTRIARKDFVSDSPLSTVGAEQFQQTGSLTAENLLNQLPQVVPDATTTSNNPSAGGRANINLRGLGSNRNLVLINGRRMIGSDSSMSVDVNTIPGALVDRVEVISGGASAVYGADAVAGVVNFILKDDFEGIESNLQYGISGEGDAKEKSADVTLGGNFAQGRGNTTLSIGYSERDRLGKGERDFTSQATSTTSYLPWGSVVFGANAPTQAAVDSVFGKYSGYSSGTVSRNDRYSFNPDGSLFSISHSSSAPAPFNVKVDPSQLSTCILDGSCNGGDKRVSYNFEPENALILPLERVNIAGTSRYKINDYIEAYASGFFTNYNSKTQLAPSPAPTGSQGSFFVPVTNPFIPADLAALAAGRANPTADIPLLTRFNTVGPRISEYENNVFQVLGGFRGDIPGINSWKYDFYAATGRVSTTETQYGNVSYNAVQSLLTAADGGASLCEGGYNPFGFNAISEACRKYVEVTAKNTTTIEQDVVELNVTGNLFELPAGAVGLALGGQYRAETYDFKADSVLASGDVSGFNAQQSLNGDVENKDLYGELYVPLLADLPFAKQVSVTAGYRFSDHSAAGTFSSYKGEGSWEVNDLLRLRGSYQRAVRAPNIGELYSPQDEDNPEVLDPCNVGSSYRTGANAAAVRALCLAQGVPAGLIDSYEQSNDQVDALVGGNPNLSEEKADTFTIGTVLNSPFQNEYLANLTLSVDYYNIKVKDAISSIDAELSIPRCFNSNGDNPSFAANNFYCQLFKRRGFDGSIEDVQQTSANLSNIKTSGIDVQLDWSADLPSDLGRLGFNFVGTWVDTFKEQALPGDAFLEYAGSIGTSIGDAIPEWKGTFTTTHIYGPVTTQVRARYIGAMEHRQVRDGSGTAGGVPATWYFDLNATYDVSENISLRGGIVNAFDQKPRLYTPNVQDNTDPSVYDVVGRRFFAGVTAKF
ncbi:TonB-dependent receptor domain-containing protein [Oleisolibacter albus]|uniref:TonB-dependent receptor domain-containing protein n=1 Tax=Oleisolibacter albus TaxID=2171757 RepID=UPI000DF1768F|nr:TonB-dependent receptor [Oleisolibacter albus]